jgi:polyisoprenoid-binding protein YceI
MASWVFEPGHTAAEFRARHMMVCWVRGHIKDVHGSLGFDPDDPARLSVEATLEANKLWTGEPQRDDHLRSGDFLDAAKHPTITFKSTGSKCVGASDYEVAGELTVRGVSRPVVLQMHYLGKWSPGGGNQHGRRPALRASPRIRAERPDRRGTRKPPG